MDGPQAVVIESAASHAERLAALLVRCSAVQERVAASWYGLAARYRAIEVSYILLAATHARLAAHAPYTGHDLIARRFPALAPALRPMGFAFAQPAASPFGPTAKAAARSRPLEAMSSPQADLPRPHAAAEQDRQPRADMRRLDSLRDRPLVLMPEDRAAPVPQREAMLTGLAEPLTSGEFEVLVLLARRLSSKEITATLGVSWQTVAKRTQRIYDKLSVTGRRDAVERAAALGVLAAASGGAAPSAPVPQPPLPFSATPRRNGSVRLLGELRLYKPGGSDGSD